MMLDASNGRIYTTPHVRFVPEEFPGISVGTGGRKYVQPSFAPKQDSNGKLDEQTDDRPADACDLDPEGEDLDLGPEDQGPRQNLHPPRRLDMPEPLGGPAARAKERVAARGQANVGFAGPLPIKAVKAVKEAVTDALSHLNLPEPTGNFFLYLGCGDLRAWNFCIVDIMNYSSTTISSTIFCFSRHLILDLKSHLDFLCGEII